MNFKIFTLITFLTTTQLVYAENHLLVLGGGGEPQTETTIFDGGMNNFGNNLKRSNWKYEVSFNGGHSKTEKILKKKFSNSKTPITNFTSENFTRLIGSYKNKILSGEIKSGDQLMIMISTHGAEKGYQELTHSISLTGGAATNLNTLAGSDLISLDKLQEIVKLTNERGINLGIIDLSCHSGNTLALKKNSTNTCIISASGPKHYGYAGGGSFADAFLSALTPGINLEEAFLKSRLNSKDSAYPMISTNENDKIVKDVYNSITPYLYYYNPNADKMTSYIFENSNPLQLCKRNEDFDKLISKIDNLKSVLNSNKNTFNTDILKNLLYQYKSNQDDIFKAIKEMGVFNLEKVETFSIPPNASSFVSNTKTQYTWSELLFYDIESIINIYQKQLSNSKSDADKKDNQSVINLLKQVQAKKQQIIIENPKLMDNQSHTSAMIKAMNNTEIMARKIATQEKKLYEELYRRSQNMNSNDPCKKIVF